MIRSFLSGAAGERAELNLALEVTTRLYTRRKSVATAVEAESGQKYRAS